MKWTITRLKDVGHFLHIMYLCCTYVLMYVGHKHSELEVYLERLVAKLSDEMYQWVALTFKEYQK